MDDHDSTGSDVASNLPMFQTQLMHFLDTKAPVLGNDIILNTVLQLTYISLLICSKQIEIDR